MLWRRRWWRIAVVSAAGAITAVPIVAVPVFAGHPFTVLYAYVLFAAWYGTLRESVGAVAISVAAVAVLQPRFPALPLEALIFACASILLLALVRGLRRARARAQEAQRRTAEALRVAVEAVRVRDDLLSAVSHDLKNPLTAIKGRAQTLQRRLDRDGASVDAAQVVEGLTSIDATATKMGRLLDELLDSAEVQTGRLLALRLQPTDLVALAREAAAEYQESAEHHIEVEAPVASLVGLWDAQRLDRVLSNLLSNAIKYSRPGSAIVLSLRPEAPGWAVLDVRDQGVGIPAADVPRIFERFARASNVGSAAGSGIGLAVVRQIVEAHGGRITVRSQEGLGSTFTVRLPRSTGADPAEGSALPETRRGTPRAAAQGDFAGGEGSRTAAGAEVVGGVATTPP
jgi:signal transduction histidine kinase